MDYKSLRVGNHIEIRNTGHELLSMAMTELEGNTGQWVRTVVDLQILEWMKNGTTAWEFRPIKLTSAELEQIEFKHIVGSAIWDDYKLSEMDEIWHCGNGYFIDENNPFNFNQHTDEDTYTQLKWVSYVHEVQNLYFALEGEELKHTPPPKERVIKSITQHLHKCNKCGTDDSVTLNSELADDGITVQIDKCKECGYIHTFEELFPNFK